MSREQSQDVPPPAVAITDEYRKKVKRWFPLENNPEILDKYMARLGVEMDKCPFRFTDVFGLDEELLMMVPQPVLAVLLVYPINAATEQYNVDIAEKTRALLGPDKVNPAYFMKQTIPNACGTVALGHGIANNANIFEKIAKPGSFIARFLSETKTMTPDERAEFLETDQSLDDAQAVSASEGQTSNQDIDTDINLHFVCLTRSPDGQLVELDGRKPFPIPHGPCAPDGVLSASAGVVKKFIEIAKSDTFSITALARSDDSA